MAEDKYGAGGKFWNTLEEIHFYKSKAEGLFKGIAITLSWCGGVNISNFSEKTIFNNVIAASFFLFSIALIMEYAVQLVTVESFLKKIVPGLMVLPSVIVLLVSGGELLNRPLAFIALGVAYKLTIFPQIIIWIDILTQIFIERPKGNKTSIEEKLQKVNLEGKNG